MLLFSPLEFIEKLAAIIPKPRVHIVRYHGLFAPHSKNREKIVLKKTKRKRKLLGRQPKVVPLTNLACHGLGF